MSTRQLDEAAIFSAARKIDAIEARDAYLREVCGDDQILRDRVAALLQAHAEDSGFLESPAVSLAPAPDITAVSEKPGSTIGPYKLLEQIGSGGMGLVFMAEQQRPMRRLVALKIIKPGMDTRQVIARFEAERQALALMDHPNIAKVLDAGDTGEMKAEGKRMKDEAENTSSASSSFILPHSAFAGGRPYFVMELVRGIPVTEYCDQARLSTRDRLKLFITICEAVQHAHQKGIIHRDLKPSNILVTMHDDKAVPKVIDFGVAKATNQRLVEQTFFTNFAQMIGTPTYMSPEQAQMSGLDVDTRSDVYSLGVLLYELLTGSTPFDKKRLHEAGYDEMRRIIRDEEPPRPSARVTSLDVASQSTIAGNRTLDRRKFSQALRGDLDWIVMKALEKDRTRRYESASGLAADVGKFLRDDPVEARPPSARYRLRKFARRNTTVLVTSIVVLSALLLGTAVSVWQAVEANAARKVADERLENEKQARADAVKQRRQASENLQKALDAVDQMLMRVADERLAAIPGTEPVRQELFQDALKFYEEFFRKTPEDAQLRISMAKAWSRVGSLHNFLGNHRREQEARQEAIRTWEALHAESPNDQQLKAAMAEDYAELGGCQHWLLYEFAAATPTLQRAIALYQDLHRRFPEKFDYAWNETWSEVSLADNYKCTGRLELVEPALRHAVDVQRQLWNREPVSGKRHATLCDSLFCLAYELSTNPDRSAETEQLCAEAVRRGEEVLVVAPQSVSAAKSLVRAGTLYADFLKDHGRIAEAETHFRRAVEVGERLLRGNPRAFHGLDLLSKAQLHFADMLARQQRWLESLPLFRSAGAMMRPAALLTERCKTWDGICQQADQGLLTSLQQAARGGYLDEARTFCEELSRADGTVAERHLSRVFAARAWDAIGDVERSKALLSDE